MSSFPLVGTAQLAALLNHPKLVLLDVRSSVTDPERGPAAFAASHIAGARFADLNADVCGPRSGANGRHPLAESKQFCENMRRLGVCRDSIVVLYDDGDMAFAPRLWYTLQWVGFDRVQILDGGFAAWKKEKRPTASGPASAAPAGDLQPAAPLVRCFMVEEIEENLRTKQWTLIDARSHGRYLGKGETVDPVAGHIPGAWNRPFAENLENGRMKAPAQLHSEWEKFLRGTDPRRVILYCGSGVTACSDILAMRIAGFPCAGLYVGSWSEWIADPRRPVSRVEETPAL